MGFPNQRNGAGMRAGDWDWVGKDQFSLPNLLFLKPREMHIKPAFIERY